MKNTVNTTSIKNNKKLENFRKWMVKNVNTPELRTSIMQYVKARVA